MDPEPLLLKHHDWKQHLIPILAVRTLHEHAQLQEGLGDLVPAVQLLIHSCGVAEGGAWNWEFSWLPLSRSSLSLPSCKAACTCRTPYQGNPMGKTTGHSPQLVSVTGDCGAGAAWKGRHTDKPSFLKPVEKEDLNWSSSQIIRMC